MLSVVTRLERPAALSRSLEDFIEGGLRAHDECYRTERLGTWELVLDPGLLAQGGHRQGCCSGEVTVGQPRRIQSVRARGDFRALLQPRALAIGNSISNHRAVSIVV